ncbi:inner membrane CreD family protein [bacterium]|nr:inner membrane CreD family protein [bacterium]
MVKKILPIIAIFVVSWIAWGILGSVTSLRSGNMYSSIKKSVASLWGSEQVQYQPIIKWFTYQQKLDKDGKRYTHTITHNIPLDSSDIDVNLNYEPRKKGLLWYNLYKVAFSGEYVFNTENVNSKKVTVYFTMPSDRTIYDDFRFSVNGEQIDLDISSNVISYEFNINKMEKISFSVAYVSRGSDIWEYGFSQYDSIGKIKNFSLNIGTDFLDYDFPEDTISPTTKTENEGKNLLTWKFENLLSGFNIGVKVPDKLNPGPWVAKVSYFAPVSLLFFFIVIFVISLLGKIDLHPMHFLFLAASFFSFHLLLAYLADHIPLLLAFSISSVVSIFLVVSYLRIVAGAKFAFFKAGIAQLIYLVIFTYVHFFEGYSGLMVTIMSIITLFILMQLTAKVDWNKIGKN